MFVEMLKLQGCRASVTEAVGNELRKREQKGRVEAWPDTPGEVSEDVGSSDGRVMLSSLGMEDGGRGSDNRSSTAMD